MSESDRAVVEHQIKEAWKGEQFAPLRGWVQIPRVREGGLTELLIKIAAEVADKYYGAKSG